MTSVAEKEDLTGNGAKQALGASYYAKLPILFSSTCGGIALGSGAIVIIGWNLHLTALIQVFPGQPAMAFNTALGFVLCGAALFALTTRGSLISLGLGALVVLFSSLTLLEYLAGLDIGIDQFFINPYIQIGTEFPGRMAPLTAICFLLLGMALTLAWSTRSIVKIKAVGILACVVAVVGCVTVFGYSVGIDTATGWGSYSRMAVNTAATFLTLSVGLLVWAWNSAGQDKVEFLRWLPVTGAVTLMIMVALVSSLSFAQFKLSNSRREHSYAVLATSDAILGDLFGIRRNAHIYVFTGQVDALAMYKKCVADAPLQLAQLQLSTRDNPGQQEHLRPITSELNEVIAGTDQLIEARKVQGVQAVVQLESSGQGVVATNQCLADLQAFTEEEHRLLKQRSEIAETDFNNTERLLVYGSLLATVLLVLANLMASREMRLRHSAQDGLAKSREHLKAILNGSVDGVIVYESIRDEAGAIRDLRFVMVNPAAEKLMGVEASTILGGSLLNRFPSVATDGLFAKFIRIIEEDAALEFEYESSRQTPPVWYRLAGVKLGDGLALHYSDITPRKQYDHQLEVARERAEASDRAKSEFLAIMSHEIRTPMNGVIGMTSILADTELTSMQRDCVSTISSSGESLMIVINDILDYSKIEAGRMQLESRSFNLRNCVEEALDLFAAQIRIKRLEAVYLVANDIPPHLVGDAMRLRQTLVNLIGNAIKFTAAGEIAINVECQKRDDAGYHLRFSVTDTGIGISKDGIEKLFQAFQQADTSTTRRYGGTGLGLVISKRLAEFMGGTMWVESQVGIGSTFFFSVVLKGSDEPVPEHQSPVPGVLVSRTALIVDDNTTNRRILETQLKIWGMCTESVSSGADALKKIEEQSFDAILIDFQMPEMDGLTLAREIRKLSKIPFILLSSSGEIITGEDSKLFQIQIPKPIKQTHLFNALLTITGIKPKVPPRAIEKKFNSSMALEHPLRILLAEDNVVNQMVGQLMLSRLGYHPEVAASGQLALVAIEKNTFDLILMDIQMPDMDGIEAARRIHERLGGKCPSIFALTAESLEGDRERFLSLGFDGYLSKPLQAQALQKLLKTVKSRIFLQPELPLAARPSDVKSVEPLNNAALRKLNDYGEGNRSKLIELFIASAPTSIADMRRAIETLNGADLSMAAHTLKGSSSNFGAAPLRELCAQIEETRLNGDNTATAELVVSAERELNRLIEALNPYRNPKELK